MNENSPREYRFISLCVKPTVGEVGRGRRGPARSGAVRRGPARRCYARAMKLAGDYRFEAAVREVWDALFDPAVLAAVMPGCEKLERVDGQFVGENKV